MSPTALPSIKTLPESSTAERAAVLDLLFEPCVQLHTLCVELLRRQAFSSYDDLIANVGVMLTELAESKSTSDAEWLNTILGAHPRLGEKTVDSAQSRAEQAQLHSGVPGQQERLQALNVEYEKTFPGLRYVVFVNGRDRGTIAADMEARIKRRDFATEKFDAIKAMCDIAADRASKISRSQSQEPQS